MKHFDLIDWTIQKAMRLRPAERQTVSASYGPSSTENTMEIFEPERAKLSSDDENQTHGAPDIQAMAEQVATPLPRDVVVAAPKPAGAEGSPAAVSAASSISAETSLTEPNSNLLKATAAPTKQIDRARAIELRWVLRDIKSDRLKWFPVNPNDLRMLIEMGLVEMRGEIPQLTNAGIDAII
jgi:hypothetical protein